MTLDFLATTLRRPLYATACTMALLFLCACSGNKENGDDKKITQTADNPNNLKVAVMPTLDCLPIYVAQERGFFSVCHADVLLKTFMAQMDCDEAIKAKKVDMTVSDLMRTERLIAQGTPLTYVTATNAYWQLICHKTARVTKVDQLSDKMLGMSRYSATDYLGTLAVDSAKPKYPVFRIQINDVGIRLKMLLNKEIDAVMLTEPQATVARMANHKVLADSRYNDIRLGVIAIRTDALAKQENKQKRDAFITAYNMACDSINEKGIAFYAPIVRKYCHVDDKVIKALPKMNFSHASSPRQTDIDRTKNVKWKTF